MNLQALRNTKTKVKISVLALVEGGRLLRIKTELKVDKNKTEI